MNFFNPFRSLLFFYACLFILFSCKPEKKKEEQIAVQTDSLADKSGISKSPFGKVDGQEVDLYTITNASGASIKVTNYGGIITAISVPDKNGVFEDVVLGYDSLSDYLKENPYFGAIVGRYGNRIGNAKFKLDGKEYKLAENNGANSLHGGIKGFDKAIWKAEEVKTADGQGLKLTYLSKDGEEGFPGNLQVEVNYLLTNDNSLSIDYKATTDKTTILGLTQHTYFNLTGGLKRDILDHQVMIEASRFLPVDKSLIPTGKLQDVKGTPFDFTTSKAIGDRIYDKKDIQIKFGNGYDHCWVLDHKKDSLNLVASVLEPVSGRKMEVLTTEPAIQFYTSNFLDGKLKGKGGKVYNQHAALCLETEHFPDSPNKPEFPSVVLHPGENYHTTTIYTFSVKK